MSQPYVTRKKAQSLASGILLIGLALLSYTGYWWPGILLILGVAFACRQALLGKWYDAILLVFVFVGIFVAYLLPYRYILMPVIFLIAGIYLMFRDVSEPIDEEEEEEEIQLELKDKDDK